MVANRSLGNPTDRDDNGGLRNRMCNGSRTAVLPETAGYTTEPYRACAPHFYPNQYGQDLQNNLRDLHERLKTKRYRHQPIRRVHIPKEKQGQSRPIGISTVSANYPGWQRVFGVGRSSTPVPPAQRLPFPGP